MYPSVTTVRDSTQIYNARRTSVSTTEEYFVVMKTLESKGIITRLPMVRGQAPVLIISQDHTITEIKRCCNTSNVEVNVSVLCK